MDTKADLKRSAEQPAALEKGTAAEDTATVRQSSSGDHKLRWADVWDNKRVLGFSMDIPVPITSAHNIHN